MDIGASSAINLHYGALLTLVSVVDYHLQCCSILQFVILYGLGDMPLLIYIIVVTDVSVSGFDHIHFLFSPLFYNGQLVVASLLNRDVKLRLLLRDPQKATTLFGEQDDEKLQVIKGDTRNSQDLDPSMFEGVTHVICCTGTTAFPSKRWDGDNTPERVDWEGVRNLVSVLPRSLSRLILVSSVGVTKSNELPWRGCLDMRFESDYVILSNQNEARCTR
ncbi:NAD(P)-binding Rossmann-fold superfamily protein [Tanacetum coccineum]